MTLYQLGEYNTKNDLSEQAKQIRDFVIKEHDFDSISNLIQKFEFLEDDSILILKKAILAGYWTSYYGFGWTKEQEIGFWENVHHKNPSSAIAKLTLAESYRGNKVKNLLDVFELYLEAVSINLEHYFSLTQDGGEELDEMRKSKRINKKLLQFEIEIMTKFHNYTKEEIIEEKQYLLKRCNGDLDLEMFVQTELERILIDKIYR